MHKIFSVVLVATVFVSCKNSGDRQAAEPALSTPTTITTPPPPAPVTSQSPVNNAPANGAATTAMNPVHGAPGHRCDIPVGAPLNSPAGAPAANGNPAPVQFQPPVLSQPVNGNARLNPAHGAPGHDCSVPVGQPLKG